MVFVDIVKIKIKSAKGRNSWHYHFVIKIVISIEIINVIAVEIDSVIEIAIVNLLCNFVLQII